MMAKRPLFLFIIFLVMGSVCLLSPIEGKEGKARLGSAPEILIPIHSPIFLVVKGIFATRQEAEKVRAFIQQLLVNTPADGIIESTKLDGFPKDRWVVASAFDGESKAKWWLNFSDRNPTLPRPFLKKTQLLEKTLAIPYFPEALREGVQRFHTEQEVLARIAQFPDVQSMKGKGAIKFLFLSYPRSRDYSYEVEVMISKGKGYIAYDFIAVSAVDLNHYSRYSENLRARK